MSPRPEKTRLKTARRDDRIVAFYAEGLTLAQLSKALHTSIDTARMVLNERGIPRRRTTDSRPELKARNDYIVNSYKQGKPLSAIAQEVGLSQDGARFILNKVRGVPCTTPQDRQEANRPRDQKIAALYRKGLTIKQAGAELGVSFSVARDVLLRLKVPIRTSGIGRKLPEQDRWKKMRRRIAAAADLYTVKGLSTAQIGERLGLQPHTVAKNLKRMGVTIRQGKSSITPEQVQRIRDQLTNRHATPQRLAGEYGLSEASIRAIGTGKTWRHVPWRTTKRYKPHNNVKLDAKRVRELKRLLAQGRTTHAALRRQFSLTTGMLRHIMKGTTWASVPWPPGTRLPLPDRRTLKFKRAR